MPGSDRLTITKALVPSPRGLWEALELATANPSLRSELRRRRLEAEAAQRRAEQQAGDIETRLRDLERDTRRLLSATGLSGPTAGGSIAVLGDDVVAARTFGMAPNSGVSEEAAREDHSHGTPPLGSSDPRPVGLISVPGVSAIPSRADHVHLAATVSYVPIPPGDELPIRVLTGPLTDEVVCDFPFAGDVDYPEGMSDLLLILATTSGTGGDSIVRLATLAAVVAEVTVGEDEPLDVFDSDDFSNLPAMPTHMQIRADVPSGVTLQLYVPPVWRRRL